MNKILEDKTTFSLILTVAVVAITTLILFLIKRRPKSAKNVLFMGITNSGKTSIYCQLVYKTNLLTQISITPNVGVAKIDKSANRKEKSLDVVDIPGQEKVRGKFFQMYKKTAKAVVYVIDSSTFQKDSKDIAQLLYEIITDPVIVKSKAKILILCNKQDIEFCKGEKFIKLNLEKEIELLGKISSSALESTSKSSEGKSEFGGLLRNHDKQFDFSDLKYNKIDVCEVNSKSYDDLKNLLDWLSLL